MMEWTWICKKKRWVPRFQERVRFSVDYVWDHSRVHVYAVVYMNNFYLVSALARKKRAKAKQKFKDPEDRRKQWVTWDIIVLVWCLSNAFIKQW